MEFVIEATGVADGFTGPVSSPQGRGGRVTVGALGALSSLGVLKKKKEM